ncbi:NUDIX hydrolase [Candidatus Woesearchaeota archaeon]|nr:NUDIX hydrolase [Candidatus Woesearchaeota archaeon]
MKPKRYPIATTGVVVANRKNEILLLKRTNNPYKGYWTIPGGHIEWDEDVAKCAIRETEEETGIKLDKISFLRYNQEIDRKRDWHAIAIVFHAKTSKKPKKRTNEASEIRFFSEKDAKKLKIAFGHGKTIKEYYSKSAG